MPSSHLKIECLLCSKVVGRGGAYPEGPWSSPEGAGQSPGGGRSRGVGPGAFPEEGPGDVAEAEVDVVLKDVVAMGLPGLHRGLVAHSPAQRRCQRNLVSGGPGPSDERRSYGSRWLVCGGLC